MYSLKKMQVRETQFTDRVWGIKTSHYPLKPPLNLSSKVTYKKSRSYILENPEWSNAGYEVKRKNEKKNLTASHTKYMAPPMHTPISTIKLNNQL